MAKIVLGNVSSGYNAVPLLNENFSKLVAELQEKLLYRDNPSGEPNQMENDLDMNDFSIYNVKELLLTDGSRLASETYVDAGDNAVRAESLARDESLGEQLVAGDAALAAQLVSGDLANNTYTDAVVSNAIANLNLELVEGEITTARFSFVALGGETSVTVPYLFFQESEVFLNGIHQNQLTGAYTINGAVFSFPTPLLEGDQLYILLGRALELSGYTSLHTQTFIATAAQTEFVLTGSLLSSQVMVFVNGLKQGLSTYVFNLNTLTFSEGWNEGDVVEVLAFDMVQEETLNVGPILLQRNVISSDTLVPEGFNGLSINPTITPGTTITVAPTSTWAIVGD